VRLWGEKITRLSGELKRKAPGEHIGKEGGATGGAKGVGERTRLEQTRERSKATSNSFTDRLRKDKEEKEGQEFRGETLNKNRGGENRLGWVKYIRADFF